MDTNAQRVISQYDLPPIQRISFLGAAGGFSGANLWKLTTDQGEFCIRRWPASQPNGERLSWIHEVLVHAHRNGCPFVSVPAVNRAGNTFTRIHNQLWEISHWMSGEADFQQNPSDERLANMMQALANFHLASAQISLDFQPSSGVSGRIWQLANVDRKLVDLERSSPATHPQITESLRQLVVQIIRPLAAALHSSLNRFADAVLPVQPVIRDIWHDHVLFTANRVTGLIDFGAMRVDNISLDISRLLGSTVNDDHSRWDFAQRL